MTGSPNVYPQTQKMNSNRRLGFSSDWRLFCCQRFGKRSTMIKTQPLSDYLHFTTQSAITAAQGMNVLIISFFGRTAAIRPQYYTSWTGLKTKYLIDASDVNWNWTNEDNRWVRYRFVSAIYCALMFVLFNREPKR